MNKAKCLVFFLFLCMKIDSVYAECPELNEVSTASLERPIDSLQHIWKDCFWIRDSSYTAFPKKVKVSSSVLKTTDSNKIAIVYFGSKIPSFAWILLKKNEKYTYDYLRPFFSCGLMHVDAIPPVLDIEQKYLNELNDGSYEIYEIRFCWRNSR